MYQEQCIATAYSGPMTTALRRSCSYPIFFALNGGWSKVWPFTTTGLHSVAAPIAPELECQLSTPRTY